MTVPSASSVLSSLVVMVYVAVVPLTVIGLAGAGLALMVNEAVPPSVIALPPEMVITGSPGPAAVAGPPCPRHSRACTGSPRRCTPRPC